MIKAEARKGGSTDVKVTGNMAVVCLELEELIRGIRMELERKLGEGQGKAVIGKAVENGMKSLEEVMDWAWECTKDMKDETVDKIVSNLRNGLE